MGWLRLTVPRCAGQEAERSSVAGREISRERRADGSAGGASSHSSSVSRERLRWDMFLKSGLCVFSELYVVASVKRGIAICLMWLKILTNYSLESYSEQ